MSQRKEEMTSLWSGPYYPRGFTWKPSGRSGEALRFADAQFRKRVHRERELWFESEVDGWVVAYRLLPREGAPIVAELRIFPGTLQRRASHGEWSNRVEDVPRGGLPMGLVHRVVVAPLWRTLTKFRRDHGGSALGRGLYRAMDIEPRAPREARAAGRRPTTELELLRVAVLYTEGETRQAIAERLNISPATVTDYIYRARHEAKLLTPTKQGKRGGELTQKALDFIVNAPPSRGSAHGRSTAKATLIPKPKGTTKGRKR